jgi:hypothetical protein
MSVFELARKYHPRLWDEKRLQALRDAGKLTAEEYQQLTGEDSAE